MYSCLYRCKNFFRHITARSMEESAVGVVGVSVRFVAIVVAQYVNLGHHHQ